jgi:hypothetical protein
MARTLKSLIPRGIKVEPDQQQAVKNPVTIREAEETVLYQLEKNPVVC